METNLAVINFLIEDLVKWQPVLSKALHPTGSSGAIGGAQARSKPPLRIDILDLMTALQSEATVWEATARRVLGFGSAPNRNLIRSLRWVNDAAPAMADHAPKALNAIYHDLKGHHYRISIAVGVTPKPLRLRLACPYCKANLTVNVDTAIIWCKNAECRCVVETCACRHGIGHFWPQADWPMLERMTRDTPENERPSPDGGGA